MSPECIVGWSILLIRDFESGLGVPGLGRRSEMGGAEFGLII